MISKAPSQSRRLSDATFKEQAQEETVSLEELLIKYCSPTLAGLKTGSLVSCLCFTREKTIREIRLVNQTLMSKGLCALPLRYMNGRVLIYLFRPDQLKRDLSNTDAVSVLLAAGYRNTKPEECLLELIRRLNGGGEFPHEIGLFLGYPPEDVRGFIENGARNFKCVGCWKVYGDEREAKKRFAQYKRCTDVYCQCWKSGKSIVQLAVPTL